MENDCRIVAVVGNPKAGKSTVFNGLTGLCRHTGSWWGDDGRVWKGQYRYCGDEYMVVDWPGMYSLNEWQDEGETVSCGRIRCTVQRMEAAKACTKPDVIVVVADATRLELGLHLLKQVVKRENDGQMCTPVVLCVNFWDEVLYKGMEIDVELMEDVLQMPVVPCCARRNTHLDDLKAAVCYAGKQGNKKEFRYDCLDFSPKRLAGECISANPGYGVRRVIADSILTSPLLGKFILLFFLAGGLRLAMAAAGVPSQLMWDTLARAETWLQRGMESLGLPYWLSGCLAGGGFRALAWTVAVMLPPLAVFLFCFTLLEDWGILPRASYNMDCVFERCGGCGGQCLTMALGLGCNAAGVACCKSIRSPRERLVAVLTNSMIPCCGRFPVFIALIPLFFAAGPSDSLMGSLSCALFFAVLLLSAVYLSMGISWLLSCTLLKGHPSAFTLELPPYRKIQLGSTLVRSLVDRTLVLVERAVLAAVPAGMIVWLLANLVYTGPGNGLFSLTSPGMAKTSLLAAMAGALDPLAALLGLDGVILAAFILAFPANELILPILAMAYLQGGSLASMDASFPMYQVFTSHGWTWTTALCTLIFAIFHWPCLPTCRAIARETKGWKWAGAAVCISTLPGILLCMGIAFLSRMAAGI